MSSVGSEIHVSPNDVSSSDEQYIENLEKKTAAKNKRQQNQRQNQQQQLEQKQETEQKDNYYFSSLPPTIPYERIEEVLRPNTGRTPTEQIRNTQVCPICSAFRHHNRFLLKAHIESHIEFAELRRFMLTSEREYKKLLKKRYELRQIELPRLQTEISELDSQIRRFKDSVDTKDTALRIEEQIRSRRQQGKKDWDDDPWVQSPTIFSLIEEEQEGGEQEK